MSVFSGNIRISVRGMTEDISAESGATASDGNLMAGDIVCIGTGTCIDVSDHYPREKEKNRILARSRSNTGR